MPCNSDYLNPNDAEKNSATVAKHLVYVMTTLGMAVPKEYMDASVSIYGNTEILDEMVVRLCYILSSSTEEELDLLVYNSRSRAARELANWWEEHQEADKRRIKEEKTQTITVKFTNSEYKEYLEFQSRKNQPDSQSNDKWIEP